VIVCKKILFTGSHGTGKSTAALSKAAEMKLSDRSLAVKVIEENVREVLRLSKGVQNSEHFQKLCFVDHLYKELEFSPIYDVLVCDRTCLDTLVYGLVYGIKLPPSFLAFAIDHLNSFSEIYFYRPKNAEQEILNDGLRDTDKILRLKVDAQFESVFKLWGGTYIEVRN
jgi:AAA domain